jgi:6-phospho-3-hexuloisomerase
MEQEITFRNLSGKVLAEVTRSLSMVDDAQAAAAVEKLLSARKVFAVGVGRVMIMLQAFVKRLNHLGIEAYFVGEVNEPAITADDLLIVASGSGESVVPVAIEKVATKFHPTILYIGSNRASTAAGMAGLQLRIPCRTKLNLPDELDSVQPMSSLFEQSLLLTLDTLAFMIVEQKHLVMNDLWHTHANLE